MDVLVDLLTGWKDLIVSTFNRHPMASTAVTMFAIGIDLWLERGPLKDRKGFSLLAMIGAWAVLLPLLGMATMIVGRIWSFITLILPFAQPVADSFNDIYARHPAIVIAIIGLAIVAAFAWKRWRPTFWPNPWARAATLFVLVIGAAHVAGAIADRAMD